MQSAFVSPASFAQERFWLASQIESADLSATLTWTFEIDGPLDVAAVRRAVNDLPARHEILRSRFAFVEGKLVQVVPESLTLSLPVEHTTSSPQEWAEDAARAAFDLGHGPLFTARLLRQHTDRHYLQLRFHHIVVDAWSVRILLDELGVLYHGGRLPDPAITYADFASWQRNSQRQALFDRQLSFWAGQLADAEPSELARESQVAPGSERVELPAQLVTNVRRLARNSRATLYMCLLAGFCAALRLDHPWIGVPIADRPDPRLADVVGPFVNTVVLDIDVSGDPTYADLLTRVRETILNAQANKDVPFEHVVRRVRPGRKTGENPLADTLFVVHSGGMPTLTLSGLSVRRVDITPPPPPVGLVASLVEDGVTVSGRLDYRSDLRPPRSAAQLVTDFQATLRGAAADPGRRLSELLPVVASPAQEDDRYPGQPATNAGDPTVMRDLCTIWAEVIGIDQVDPSDDFFEVGGYSLLAVQIISRIEERFGAKITIRQLFENPSVAELSRLL
jgi:acyl carrier protein